MITLTALAALGREGELAMHVRAALRNGLSPEQIGEVLLQVASTRACPRPTAPSPWPSKCWLSWAPRTARPRCSRPAGHGGVAG